MTIKLNNANHDYSECHFTNAGPKNQLTTIQKLCFGTTSVLNLIGSHPKSLQTLLLTVDWDIWNLFGIENGPFMPFILEFFEESLYFPPSFWFWRLRSRSCQRLRLLFRMWSVLSFWLYWTMNIWFIKKSNLISQDFKILKRQFAFIGAPLGPSETESMVLKCQIKVCAKADDATCSTTNKAGIENVCPSRTYNNPSKNRRSRSDESKIVELSKDDFKKKRNKIDLIEKLILNLFIKDYRSSSCVTRELWNIDQRYLCHTKGRFNFLTDNDHLYRIGCFGHDDFMNKYLMNYDE